MKIKFPDHLTGGVTTEPLRAINPQGAPLRILAELQMETGWTVQEFQERGKTFFGHAMSMWLTLHNAGFTTITWDQAQDLTLDAVELIEEPGDRAAAKEAARTEDDASDPASPASSPDDAPATPRPASTRSKQQSRGSTAKSARGSRTS